MSALTTLAEASTIHGRLLTAIAAIVMRAAAAGEGGELGSRRVNGDSRRLMVIKGFGGPPAAMLCPLISDLAELAVVYEHTETAFIEVDPDAEVRAVNEAGDYIEAGGPDEVVPAALAYAADHEIDGVFTVSEPLLRQTAEIAERL